MLPFTPKIFNLFTSVSLLNPCQSSFCSHHSTETILVTVTMWWIHVARFQGSICSPHFFLDISTVFGVVDHPFLKHFLPVSFRASHSPGFPSILAPLQFYSSLPLTVPWTRTLCNLFAFTTLAHPDAWQTLHCWLDESACLLYNMGYIDIKVRKVGWGHIIEGFES